MHELQNQVRALEVERDLLLSRAQQDLRMAILPLEQAPQAPAEHGAAAAEAAPAAV